MQTNVCRNVAKKLLSTNMWHRVKPRSCQVSNLAQIDSYKTQDTNEHNVMHASTNLKTSYSTTTAKTVHLFGDTIGDLLEQRSLTNAADMLYGFPHQGVILTYGELSQRAEAVAQNFLNLGFKKGERVAFLLPNCYELVVLYFAACKIGLISVVLNPAYQAVELEYMLNKTGVKGVFFYDSFKVLKHMELFNKLCPELETSLPGELVSTKFPNLKHLFVLNSPLLPEKKTYKGTWDFTKFSQPNSSGSKIEWPYVDVDDPSTILFTVRFPHFFLKLRTKNNHLIYIYFSF